MEIQIRNRFFTEELLINIHMQQKEGPLSIVLKNDTGEVCREQEIWLPQSQNSIVIGDLGDLPYGRYRLDIDCEGRHEEVMLVKRF